ncbi:MAG: PAS domain S-box protein, partial [Nitrospirota bacterium]
MATTMNPYSLLIVEDNQDLVMGLQDLLHHDGYAVTAAGTVAAALKLIRAHRFNAILLDLGLPDGDGLEVLKESQRLDPSLPVVIVTAHISSDRTVGSLAQGAYAYLTKPYDREELRHTLRRAIGVKELAVKVEQTEHLLSQSEERFRSLVDSATDAIVVADHRGVIVSWNWSASTLFGYADEEAIGQPLTLLMPARYHQAHEQGLAHMESTGKSRVMGSVIEVHGLKKDGTEFPIELSLATWKSAKSSYYSGIIRDISERKKADDALRRHEQLLHAVVNNTTAVIYVKYSDGRYLLINHRFEQLFHITMEQIAGRTDHEIFPKDIADAFRANDVTVLELKKTVEYEEQAPHEDGLHTYLSIKFPLCDQTGKPYATCGISTDITERKRIDGELRANDCRTCHALTAAPVGLWGWDLQTGQLYWSPQVDMLLGVAPGSVRGTQNELLALVHPDDRETIVHAMRHALEPQPADVTFEHRVLRSDGSVFWCVWTGEIIRDQDGIAVHILGTVRAT